MPSWERVIQSGRGTPTSPGVNGCEVLRDCDSPLPTLACGSELPRARLLREDAGALQRICGRGARETGPGGARAVSERGLGDRSRWVQLSKGPRPAGHIEVGGSPWRCWTCRWLWEQPCAGEREGNLVYKDACINLFGFKSLRVCCVF